MKQCFKAPFLFQFPSNGKADPKTRGWWEVSDRDRFNSLQTGKRIQSDHRRYPTCSSIRFQFPSNGKADPKERYGDLYEFYLHVFQFPSNGKADPKRNQAFSREAPSSLPSVSIPFKRESGSKENNSGNSGPSPNSFNSLQTGKRIQRRKDTKTLVSSFNSLQTGKRIQRKTKENCGLYPRTWLFQFPSNGKADPKQCCWFLWGCSFCEFQFPSNGKADPKMTQQTASRGGYKKFQFPSNGKADPKWFKFYPVKVDGVKSFNSLQTGKRIQSISAKNTTNPVVRFNSLQTGKRIQRKCTSPNLLLTV